MKKRFLIMFSMLFVLMLTGCGETTDVAEETGLYRAYDVVYDSDEITIGFVQTGKESDWRDANTNDFLNTFTKEKGYNLIYIDGNSDNERQVKAVYDLIHQNVDYIILDPIVEEGWEEPLLMAKERGIPVIISDREVDVDPSLYTCWIGSDFKTEGVKAANWLDEYLNEIGRGDEEINIVLLEGTKGASAAIGRTEGLLSEIAQKDNWHIIAQECANFTQGEGKTVMEKILSEHDDIDVVISENDNMMFGAMKAMAEQKVEYGVDGGIITVSFDALHEAFDRMISRELVVTVECNPLIAGLSEKVIKDLEAGKEVEKKKYVNEEIFTYKNAAASISDRKY